MAGQLLMHYLETPCMSAIMPTSVAPDQLRSTAVNLLKRAFCMEQDLVSPKPTVTAAYLSQLLGGLKPSEPSLEMLLNPFRIGHDQIFTKNTRE